MTPLQELTKYWERTIIEYQHLNGIPPRVVFGFYRIVDLHKEYVKKEENLIKKIYKQAQEDQRNGINNVRALIKELQK